MDTTPMTILLVESNCDDALAFRQCLFANHAERYTLEHATRLEEALACLHREDLDVIVVAPDLPDREGLHMVTALYDQAEAPIVVLSSRDHDDAASLAIRAGAQDMLAKEDLGTLLLQRTIHHAIDRYRLMRELAHTRELLSLDRMITPPAEITATLLHLPALSNSAPDVFHALVEQYDQALEKAVENRIYSVKHNTSELLRSMSEKLGNYLSGPRDVINIHSKTINQRLHQESRSKARMMLEEGRLLVLELMGHLVSFYRNYALWGGGLHGPPTSEDDNREDKNHAEEV